MHLWKTSGVLCPEGLLLRAFTSWSFSLTATRAGWDIGGLWCFHLLEVQNVPKFTGKCWDIMEGSCRDLHHPTNPVCADILQLAALMNSQIPLSLSFSPIFSERSFLLFPCPLQTVISIIISGQRNWANCGVDPEVVSPAQQDGLLSFHVSSLTRLPLISP